MTGLFLLIIVLGWAVTCVVLGSMLFGRMRGHWYGGLLSLVLGSLILILPLVDEMIARPKFLALCEREARFELGAQNLLGLTVWYDKMTRETINLGLVRGIKITWHFVLPGTSELAYRYSTFEAHGGWLISTLGISETNSPLLFNGTCAPRDLTTFKDKWNVRIQDKPNSKTEASV